jgi:hypothetical protein
MGGSQTSEGGLGHPWATYMSSKLFVLLACLNFPERQCQKILFVGALLKQEAVQLQYLLQTEKGQ